MPDESDRVTVSTYVPPAQRDVWREDAESMGMSQSEFVRSMVQAGRRGFSLGSETAEPEQPDVEGSHPGGSVLNSTILELLSREGPLDWPELVDELTGDLESDLETALIELQEANRVRHSPREGSYSITESADGE